MVSKVKQIKLSGWSFPLALLVLCVVSFGLFTSRLGYYWDDWAKTIVHHLDGMQGYWDYYAYDRPISGWTHILLFSLIGDSPFRWHLLALLLRWLGGVGMWWSMGQLWPQARRPVAYATLLYVVYPVFFQQPITITFHQQLMQYVLYFFSLGAMIMAFRQPRRFWPFTLLSLALSLIQITITEYFVPLELLRPVVLWVLFSEERQPLLRRAGRTLLGWLPYGLTIAAYIIWRLFFIDLITEDPYQATTLFNFFSDPLSTTLGLVKVVIPDSLFMLLSTWVNALEFGLVDPDFKANLLILVFGVFTTAVLAVYLLKFEDSEPADEQAQNNWYLQALVIGLIATVLGVLPAWITGRQVVWDFHSNRYAQPAMFGLAMLWTVGVLWVARSRVPRAVLLSCLIGLAVTLHIRTDREYARAWEHQKALYWQLQWRAPHIEPGTAIFFEEEPFSNQGLFSTSAAINMIYPQSGGAGSLSYYVYSLRPKFASIEPKAEIPVNSSFRSLHFEGQIPDSLLIYYQPGRPHCMWLLSPLDAVNPELTDLTKEWLFISNLDRIQPADLSEDYPSEEILGSEPQNTWCYFYQKADLARQMEDWEEVVEIAEQASAQGYFPTNAPSNHPNEWIPFIEGYARSGDWAAARDLILEDADINSDYVPRLCSLWARLEEDAPPEAVTIVQEVKQALACAGQ
jgi:hypothetical protein